MGSPVFVELSEDRKRIEVWARITDEFYAEMTTYISGPRYVKKGASYNGAAHFTVPVDMECCRELRRTFEDRLTIGTALREWAKGQVKYERNLRSIAKSDTAALKILPTVLPKLYEAIHLGPKGRWMTEEERAEGMKAPASFQAADTMWMAHTDNPLNGNHPGLGKTLETIGALYEGEIANGPKLVIAPKSALETTWADELATWQEEPVFISTGSKKQKDAAIADFISYTEEFGDGWLVVNPDQVRFRESFEICGYHCGLGTSNKMKAEMRKCTDCVVKLVSEFPTIHGTLWNAIIIDECHKGAVRNPKTLTAKGMFALEKIEEGKRIALTGTPMGGKIINLWGILHYLNPKVFTSKWRWAEMWTDVSQNEYSRDIGESIKHCERHFGWNDEGVGHRPEGCVLCEEIEAAFYVMLEPYMTRRTKKEALPWLPAKQFVPLWTDFGSEAHRKQYVEFNTELQTMIDGLPVSSVNVLDEYTRLKQFSFSRHERREDGRLIPTEDSGKLEVLKQKLDELGIWEGTGTEQAVIFSQFSQVVDLVHKWLNDNGVPASKITGAVSKSSTRRAIKEEFQSGKGPRVVVITTTAGGVSITLDAASNVFMLDETWDPDDQEQAEDRCHRASRIHQVTVYYLRTTGSIEEAIAEVTGTKRSRNVRVLDAKRLRERAKSL